MFFFLLIKSIDSLEYLESMVETIEGHLKGVKTSMPLAIFWKLFWRTMVPTDTMHYSPFPWEWLKTNQATFPAPCALDIVMMRLKRMISSPSLREFGKKIYFYHVVAICAIFTAALIPMEAFFYKFLPSLSLRGARGSCYCLC